MATSTSPSRRRPPARDRAFLPPLPGPTFLPHRLRGGNSRVCPLLRSGHTVRPKLNLRPACLAAAPLDALTSSPLLSRFLTAASTNLFFHTLLRNSGQRMLTLPGLHHALYLGILLWTTLGPSAYLLCVSFLFGGSLLTRLGRARKERLGIAESRGGKRGPENLWGAAGVAALCATIAALIRALPSTPLGPQLPPLQLAHVCARVAYSGAIAAKFADTASSEVGKAYGTDTYLITTFRKVPAGTEGAVSVQGTLAGAVAALVTALLGTGLGVIPGDWVVVLCVALAGNIANLLESIIGATIQSRFYVTNEQVNFVNTMVGATCAALLYFIAARLRWVPVLIS